MTTGPANVEPTADEISRSHRASWYWPGIAFIWVVALVGAILTGALSPSEDYLKWVSLTLAACILLTFSMQLATQQKIGFVNRVTASLVGSVVVLAAATVVLQGFAFLS